MTIFDLNGKMLFESNNFKEHYDFINIKNFASGLYLLYLKTNETTYIEKIIKK